MSIPYGAAWSRTHPLLGPIKHRLSYGSGGCLFNIDRTWLNLNVYQKNENKKLSSTDTLQSVNYWSSQNWFENFFVFLLFVYPSAGDWVTKGLTHVRLVLYYWAVSPVLSVSLVYNPEAHIILNWCSPKKDALVPNPKCHCPTPILPQRRWLCVTDYPTPNIKTHPQCSQAASPQVQIELRAFSIFLSEPLSS